MIKKIKDDIEYYLFSATILLLVIAVFGMLLFAPNTGMTHERTVTNITYHDGMLEMEMNGVRDITIDEKDGYFIEVGDTCQFKFSSKNLFSQKTYHAAFCMDGNYKTGEQNVE